MRLETARLVLAPWQSEDWTTFRPIATDHELMRFITGGTPWSDDQIRAFVERQIETYRTRGWCRWKLLLKPDESLIGFCGVGFWRDSTEPEIGWWLARACWCRGLASEAARAALQDAFERGGLQRIISIAMTGNAASIGIMRKLGLEFDGEFEAEGFRLVRYTIDRETYDARRSSEGRPLEPRPRF